MDAVRERVDLETLPPTQRLIAQLRDFHPGLVTADDKIKWDELRVLLDGAIDDRPERYRFTWAGKADAIRALRAPSWSTLVPQPDQSLNFDATQHLFLEGDNLEVLKLLSKSYFGRVKMIYIDPPYNTGNDFIYPDNFADPAAAYLAATGQADGDGNRLTTNAETSGRYHSAWLTMLYPRLFLARQLLRDDGVIFVSIDDHELHNLLILMNEVFGEENRIETFVWKKSYGGGAKEKYIVTQHEYVVLYARNRENINEHWLPPDDAAEKRYYRYRDAKYESRGPYRIKPLEATKSMDRRDNLVFPIPLPDSGEVWPKRQWWWGADRVRRALENDELVFITGREGVTVSYKQYLRDEQGVQRGAKPFSVIDGIYTQHGTSDLTDLFPGEPVMQFPKPVALLKKFVQVGTEAEDGDLALDFFAGSCSTAEAVLAANRDDGGNRRFIMVQLPEPTPAGSTARNAGYSTIADIGKERIRRVCAKLQAEQAAKLDFADRAAPEDLGFRVFALAPSNLLAWQPPGERTPDAYLAQLELHTAPLLPDWQPAAVLWEVIVKEGLGLSSTVEQVPGLSHSTVYRAHDADQDQSLLVCLDDTLHPATVAALRLAAADRFVCRDTALTDDLAANLALQCQLKTI